MNRKLLFLILGFAAGFQFLVLISYSTTFFGLIRDLEKATSSPCKEMDTEYVQRLLPRLYKNGTERIYDKNLLHILTSTVGNCNEMLPKREFDFVLRLRKLVLYSVREVNLRIQGQECARWWANPLSVSEVKELNVSRDVTQYELTFEIQPGRIPFRAVLNVSRPSLNEDGSLKYEPEELHLVGAGRLGELPKTCGTVPRSFLENCLCPEERVKAEQETWEARKEWELSDPELNSWSPNMSMFVQDYITFGTMDLYIKSPIRNKEFCGPEVKLMLFVSTNPINFKGRAAIRYTYANPEFLKVHGVKVLFVLDRVMDVTLQREIDEEFELHDDLIQGNYAHSYHNLTLRDLSMFNWIVTHCRLTGGLLPRWFMKTDDDYFINIPLTMEMAVANADAEVMGRKNCGQSVVRDSSDQTKTFTPKYYTPKYMHAPEFYAGYLSGASWLIRSDVLPSLLKASLTVPLIQIDDVYITGMLTREVGIIPRFVKEITYRRHAGPCETRRMVNSAVMNATDLLLHWEHFRQSIPSDCNFSSLRIKNLTKLTQKTKARCLFA